VGAFLFPKTATSQAQANHMAYNLERCQNAGDGIPKERIHVLLPSIAAVIFLVFIIEFENLSFRTASPENNRGCRLVSVKQVCFVYAPRNIRIQRNIAGPDIYLQLRNSTAAGQGRSNKRFTRRPKAGGNFAK
jgi:hypothetical protein